MNKKIIILSIIIILFFSCNSVFAVDSIQSQIDNAQEGDTIYVDSGDYNEDLVISKGITLIANGTVNLNSNNIGIDILNTANNTSIIGFNINILNNSNNSTGIRVNSTGCIIKDNTITGGFIGINGGYDFKYNTTNETTGENITHSNKVGAPNLWVENNLIANTSAMGIVITGFNPTVINNRINNIKSNNVSVDVTGITVKALCLGDNDNLTVTITNNTLSDISSVNNTVAFLFNAIGVFKDMQSIDVSNNTISNISASNSATGATISIIGITSKIPIVTISDYKINNISCDNDSAAVKGMDVSVIALLGNDTTYIDNFNLQNNEITNLTVTGVGASITGVSLFALCDNSSINFKNNNLTNFNAENGAVNVVSAQGIDYTDFSIDLNFKNNTISDINSKNSGGIETVCLGDVNIIQNNLTNIPGNASKYIESISLSIALPDLNITIPENATAEDILKIIDEIKQILSNITNITGSNISNAAKINIFGNNLEGSGVETAICLLSNATVNYNRIINFDTNVLKSKIKPFALEMYGYPPDTPLEDLVYAYLKSQNETQNMTDEELRNLSKEMADNLEKMLDAIDNFTSGTTDARYNWYGTNEGPSPDKFVENNGEILYDPWLVLSVNPDKVQAKPYEVVPVSVNFYHDSDGGNHAANAINYFGGIPVDITTDLGTLNGQKSVTSYLNNGQAIVYFMSSIPGLATITAIVDNATASGNIQVGDIPMLETGNPLIFLLLSIFTIFAIRPKK